MHSIKQSFLIFITGLIMNSANANLEPNIISHKITPIQLEQEKERLKSAQNLALPLADELAILEQLTEFELGRFLMVNKGLNGYWTAYIILHGPQKQGLSPLEYWMLH